MEKIKLDPNQIISKTFGIPVADAYDGFYYDYEGYIKVVLKKDKKTILYNFINEKGQELSKVWFKKCGKFKNGMVPVILTDGTHNILTSDGRLLLRKNNNYISIKHFANDFFIAQGIDQKYRLISREGKQIKRYFDTVIVLDCETKNNEQYILVKRDSKWNVIGKDGEYLLERFFINANKLKNILNVWYPTANPKVFYHKFIDLRTGNVILEGEYLNVKFVPSYNYFLLIKKDGKVNALNTEGKILFKEWYDKILFDSWHFANFACFYVYKKVLHKPYELVTLFDVDGNNIVNNIWFDKIESRLVEDFVKFELKKNKYKYVYDSKEKKLVLV